MSILLESLVAKIKELMETRLNGSITVHFSEGRIMKIEIREVTRHL